MRTKRRVRLPSPAMGVALVALFVALSGTAFAVGSTVVPLAKRALTADKAKVANVANVAKQATVADNAKKLGGQDANSLVQSAVATASKTPGPASTVAGLITIKTAPWSMGPGGSGNFTATCDAGQKVIAGGWSDPGDWSSGYQSLPTADGAGWIYNIYTSRGAPGTQSGQVYAICVK